MYPGNTTVCKMCYMEINSKAKKCPYCQHWQNKWYMITFHPLFAMIPSIIIMILIFVFMGKMFQGLFSEGEPFAQYASSVSITNTKMVFGVSDCEHKSATVGILGKIRNDSAISWKDFLMEARFFDKEGKLVDTTQQRLYYFTVMAGNESTFKVSLKREFPKKTYDSFKIRIISAKDEKQKF